MTRSVGALISPLPMTSPVDRPFFNGFPYSKPVLSILGDRPLKVVDYVNSDNSTYGCLPLGGNASVCWHVLGSMLFGAKYSQALWLYMLHDGPLTPLTLAHKRDPFDTVATSIYSAPTKTPLQSCFLNVGASLPII